MSAIVGETSLPDPTTQLIASPLTLIKRAADVDRKASDVHRYEEALLLSYTADFGFIDTVAVPLLRSTGARVTAVGDVAMANFDPRTAPRAGHGFNSGYAQCTGAFHPKLFVLASETNTRIAIGSGNATMAGWSYNHELWTVAQSSPTASPTVIPQLADWLELLPAAVRLSAGVEDRLQHTAELLRNAHASSTPTGDDARLVSSLLGPIIDQLPLGPVDELCLFAPFFDADGAALTRLVERFQPASVMVVVQPEMSRFDGTAILAALNKTKACVLADNDKVYRHGKLIEWSAAGRRWALTGSANISRSALLRAQTDGGNCELGIITEIAATLMPADTTQPSIAEIQQITITPSPPVKTPTARLLGAHLVGPGVRVQLVTPLDDPADVQFMNPEYQQWLLIDAAPTHLDTFDLLEPLAAGTRIRLASTVDGATEFSNIVAVVDLTATTTRRSDGSTAPPRYQTSSLFTGDLLNHFLEDLQALRADLKQTMTTSSESHLRTVELSGPDASAEHEVHEQRIGLPMLSFALGTDREDLDETVDDEWAQLEDDDADTDGEDLAADVLTDRSPVEQLATAAAENPRRYRRWATNGVTAMPALTATGRLAVVRLLIWMMAARVWEEKDNDGVVLLTQALKHLASEPVPAEMEASAGSLGAVALAILDRKVDQRHGTPTALAVRKARTDIAYLLPAVDSDRVSAYLRHLASAEIVSGLGFTVELDDVVEIADEVVQNDDIADALARLHDSGWDDAYRPSPLTLHIFADRNRPDLVALEAISYAENTGLMAAWCTTPTKWALVLLRRPDFVVVSGTADGPLKWQHFRIARVPLRAVVQGERSHSGDDRIFSLADRVPHRPWIKPVPLGLEILAALDLPGPYPPPQR